MFAPLRGAPSTLIAFAMALTMAFGPALAGDPPSAIVSSLNQQALPLVNAKTPNSARLEEVIDAHADIDAVLKRALKQQWRTLSEPQLKELKAQTLTLVGKAYASAMQDVDSKDITYQARSHKQKSARVGTTLAKDANAIRVDFRLRRRDTGWKVVDVIISGVSIVAVYSADFEAVLTHKGVDGLIAALRERNS
jgi:phospholipid transport system substrate-binding protein